MWLLRCVCRGVGSTVMEPQGLAGQEPIVQSTWEGKPSAYCQLCSPSPVPLPAGGRMGYSWSAFVFCCAPQCLLLVLPGGFLKPQEDLKGHLVQISAPALCLSQIFLLYSHGKLSNVNLVSKTFHDSPLPSGESLNPFGESSWPRLMMMGPCDCSPLSFGHSTFYTVVG